MLTRDRTMAAGEERTSVKACRTIEIIVRVICFIIGILLIVLGCFMFASVGGASVDAGFQICVQAFYCVVFGILCCFAEIRHEKTICLLKWVLFLNAYLGRCVFYVFLGIIVFPLGVGAIPYLGKIMAALLWAAAGLNLIMWIGRRCAHVETGKKMDVVVVV
eukprot:TRINITY_DN4999_c0_g1_i2.p1 TRINITY_DN4999_c0_g1~~TRINITY_DN4999_c0_g1_i2.p1  ORF type:complete len:162 (-),score=14.01 TRINITY_DN4999_c0_g1_i2:16-501(-)